MAMRKEIENTNIKIFSSIDNLDLKNLIQLCNNNRRYTALIILKKDVDIKYILNNIKKINPNLLKCYHRNIDENSVVAFFENGSRIIISNDIPASRGNRYSYCITDEFYIENENLLYNVIPKMIDYDKYCGGILKYE